MQIILKRPFVDKCGFLYNIDNPHFFATFDLVSGRNFWTESVVLRRILYPFLALPLMKYLGFLKGGVLLNIILHLLGGLCFTKIVYKNLGFKSAILSAFLLSTYPGIYYWIGSPYSYNCLVPFSIFSFALLLNLNKNNSILYSSLCALLIGIMSIGIDLLPYFGFAGIILLILKRHFYRIPIFIVLLILPTIISLYLLSNNYGLSISNANTNIYKVILLSYFKPDLYINYFNTLKNFIPNLSKIYLYSNFIFIPILFIILKFSSIKNKALKFSKVEWAITISLVIFFFFNHLAPAYGGWQMRGTWISRLYLPIIPVLLYGIAKCLSYKRSSIVYFFFSLAIAGNLLVVLSPALNIRFGHDVYYSFYDRKPADYISENVEKYGVRPIGFCERDKFPRTAGMRRPRGVRKSRNLNELQRLELAD